MQHVARMAATTGWAACSRWRCASGSNIHAAATAPVAAAAAARTVATTSASTAAAAAAAARAATAATSTASAATASSSAHPPPAQQQPHQHHQQTKAAKATPLPRSAYVAFRPVTTRWADNDVYGHVNNVVYYSWFDTAVNAELLARGALCLTTSPVIGLVVETRCAYFAPLAFPQAVETGVRVATIGRSSVTYNVGIFAAGAPLTAAAGHFVHVYVDRATRRPVDLPPALRAALAALYSNSCRRSGGSGKHTTSLHRPSTPTVRPMQPGSFTQVP